MKDFDLEVSVNSTSCDKPDLKAVPMETTPFPKIPNIKFVVTKGSEIEEFTSYRDLEDWFIDECDKMICAAYRDTCPDSRGGCDGPYDWVRNTFDFSEMEDFLADKGWEVKRVAE